MQKAGEAHQDEINLLRGQSEFRQAVIFGFPLSAGSHYPIFDYTDEDAWIDRQWQNGNFVRAGGALMAAAGMAEGTAGYLACMRGGCNIGTIGVIAQSGDYAAAGSVQAWTGKPVTPLGEEVLQGFGLSPDAAATLYSAVNLGSGVVATRAGTTAVAASREAGVKLLDEFDIETPRILKNQAIGNAARDAIAAERSGSVIEQNFRVTGGLRRVDILDGLTAIESKVGRTSLSFPIRQELARDVKLLRSGQVDTVEWHFSTSPTTGLIGPTKPLRDKLNKFGIPIVE